MTSRQARHQQRLAADGLCATSRAHGSAAPGSKLCRECIDANTLAVADARAERREMGLCRYSAEHGPAAPDRKACRACLNREAASQRRARERRQQHE